MLPQAAACTARAVWRGEHGEALQGGLERQGMTRRSAMGNAISEVAVAVAC